MAILILLIHIIYSYQASISMYEKKIYLSQLNTPELRKLKKNLAR